MTEPRNEDAQEAPEVEGAIEETTESSDASQPRDAKRDSTRRFLANGVLTMGGALLFGYASAMTPTGLAVVAEMLGGASEADGHLTTFLGVLSAILVSGGFLAAFTLGAGSFAVGGYRLLRDFCREFGGDILRNPKFSALAIASVTVALIGDFAGSQIANYVGLAGIVVVGSYALHEALNKAKETHAQE
ncbi:hypothetical protein CKO28_14330 [Rhodovibrio sodomensis]|uniref:Uncharacterized protein n=1 Tax=Rhodovibrio sodomensis TaxID=1088 RepID=A0ABS1DFF9_9PROT|nr:hypothetical protein [Rhodovibrio sodomensis]MBK1669211.1 hypothetical protein [Rhodovibrio sodomensis]